MAYSIEESSIRSWLMSLYWLKRSTSLAAKTEKLYSS